MHQPYATYPVYQPAQTPPMTFYGHGQGTAAVLANKPNSQEEVKKTTQTSRIQRRNQFSKEQKEALESRFTADTYVSSRVRDEIARELNMTVKQVKVWYQNRRQKERRRHQVRLMRKTSTPVSGGGDVIKVPQSAESPDSGIGSEMIFGNRSSSLSKPHVEEVKERPVIEQQHLEMPQKQQEQEAQVNGSGPVINKVDPMAKVNVQDYKYQVQHQQQQYEEKYYDASQFYSQYFASPAAAASYYSSTEYQQALANYYSNYDYMQFPGAYQYYQLMSGYQSQQQQQQPQQATQQQLYSVDPQEPQTYSAYWI